MGVVAVAVGVVAPGASAADPAAEAALDAFEREFPALAEPAWSTFPGQPDGPEVVRYLDGNSALVEAPGGRTALAEATTPLADPAAGGGYDPLDLTLERRGGALVPANAPSAVAIPATAGDGVRFEGADVAVGFAPAASDSPATTDGARAFFPGTAPATDAVVDAAPGGVEVTWQLRGPESPERLPLDFALPEGARLRLGEDGDHAEIVRDGDVVIAVSPVVALDADGRPVDARYELDGERLVVVVDHRDAGTAYPIAVDPYILENWIHVGGDYAQNWRTVPAMDFLGWSAVGADYHSKLYTRGSADFGHTTTNGLYVEAKAGIAKTGYAEWRFRAPGTSNVYRAEFTRPVINGAGCLDEGIRRADGSWEPTGNGKPGGPYTASKHPTACAAGLGGLPHGTVIGSPGYQIFCSTAPSPCDNYNITSLSPGNAAVFGIDRLWAQPPFQVYLPGAAVFLTDTDRPTLTAATNSLSGYVRTGTGTVGVTTTDTGLGVKRMRLSTANRTGSQTVQEQAHPCVGDRRDRCPATWNTARPSWTPAFTYNADTLPEGTNRFGVQSVDVVANASDGTDSAPAYRTNLVPPVVVDRTPPSAPSGAVATYYADEARAVLDWAFPSTDPALPDATPGAGIAREEVRHRLAGGTFSAWQPAAWGSEVVVAGTVGSTLDVELRAIDNAGNVSAVRAERITVRSEPADTGDDCATDQSPDPDGADSRIPCTSESYAVTWEDSTAASGGVTTLATPALRAEVRGLLENVPEPPTGRARFGATDNASAAATGDDGTRNDCRNATQTGLACSMDAIDIMENPERTASGPGAYRYLATYHSPFSSEQRNAFRTAIAGSNDLVRWRRLAVLDPGPARRADGNVDPAAAAGATNATIRKVPGGPGYLVAYEKQTSVNPGGGYRSNIRFRHYPTLAALLGGDQTASSPFVTLPRRLSTGKGSTPANEGTPNIRTIEWGTSLQTSTIRFGFHYHRRYRQGSKRFVDRQASGTLQGFSPSTGLSVSRDLGIRDALGSRGYKGHHGGRSDFTYKGSRFRVYEAQRELGDPSGWRLVLFDVDARVARTLRPDTRRDPAQPDSLSFANPSVQIATAPSGTGNVLVASSFLPSEGVAPTDPAGGLVWFNPVP